MGGGGEAIDDDAGVHMSPDSGGGGEALDDDAGVHMSPDSGGGGDVHNDDDDDQPVATFGNVGGMRRNAARALSNAGPTSGVGGLPAAAGMPTCAVDHSCGGDE